MSAPLWWPETTIYGPPRGGDPTPEQIKAAASRLLAQFLKAKEGSMTRCKVRCIGVEKTESWNKDIPFLYRSRFMAVGDGSPENKAFWQATPTGSIEFATVKEDHFKVGQSYYVDFTEAPA